MPPIDRDGSSCSLRSAHSERYPGATFASHMSWFRGDNRPRPPSKDTLAT